MCDFEKGFILCSCDPIQDIKQPKRKSKKYKDIPVKHSFRWYLSRFKGIIEEPLMEGEYNPSSKDLGNGLSEEWVLFNLNLANCFDFEYTPVEGDYLVFKSTGKYEYLSFVFSKREWIKDTYNPFSTILEKFNEGKIKELDDNQKIQPFIN